MSKYSKGPIMIVGAAVGASICMGALTMSNSSLLSEDDFVQQQLEHNDSLAQYSAQLSAQVEQFTKVVEETADGFKNETGHRVDANGNIIVEHKEDLPTEGNATYNGSNEVIKAATALWNDYCNEGGKYNQGLYGSQTKGRHDCSGFVHTVWQRLGVSVPGSSKGWNGQVAGFSLIGSFQNYTQAIPSMQEGDVIAYSGHVELYSGNKTVFSWGGYGSRGDNNKFPFDPPVSVPKPKSTDTHGACRVYRKMN